MAGTKRFVDTEGHVFSMTDEQARKLGYRPASFERYVDARGNVQMLLAGQPVPQGFTREPEAKAQRPVEDKAVSGPAAGK